MGIFVHAKQKRDIQINKKAVRCTKDLKTGPKLDFEFIVTLCQKQRKESWNLPTTGVYHIHGCTGKRKKRIDK